MFTFRRPRRALEGILLALALVACGVVQAQSNWPARPIRILVPYPAGGSTDILTRIFAQRLSESLAQPVVVELKNYTAFRDRMLKRAAVQRVIADEGVKV